MSAPGFWDAPDAARATVERLKAVRGALEPWGPHSSGGE